MLRRVIGIPGAVVLGLGSMIGTGVFVATALAAGLAGAWLPVAIVIAAGVAMLNGLSSARLATRHPVAGGTAVYARRELHPRLGTVAGWLFLMAKGASAATASLGIIAYVLPEAPPLAAVAPVLIAGALAAAGLRLSMLATVLLVGITLASLGVFVIWAAFAPPVEVTPTTAPVPTAGPVPILHASALVFVAFTGYGRVATLGEEIREPSRSIPRAVWIVVVTAAMILLTTTTAATTVAGIPGFAAAAEKNGPLATIADAGGADVVASLLRLGAVAAMGGVLLNLILGLSRVVLALARDGDLPRGAASVTSAGRPITAIVAVCVPVAMIAVTGSIQAAWTTSAAAVLAYYALTNLAALALARRDGDPRGGLRATLGTAGCLVLAVTVPPSAWWLPAIATALGLTVAGLTAAFRPRTG